MARRVTKRSTILIGTHDLISSWSSSLAVLLSDAMHDDDDITQHGCLTPVNKSTEACKSEAARQSSSLLEVAEGLCNRQSPTSQRKGKVFKKLAPEVEKHLFNEMQRDVCKNMWQEARKRVYGTPSKGTEKSTETVNPPAGHGV